MATVVGAVPGVASASESRGHGDRPEDKHVLLISVDGLHASDLSTFIVQHRRSTLAALSGAGTTYTNTATGTNSDSFPGLLAQVTGGTEKSTGVYYDDSYDRTLFPPPAQQPAGYVPCSGPAGTEALLAENLDVGAPSTANHQTGTRPILAATIDPLQLPQQLVGGHCTPVYPNKFLRTNTIFSVASAAGLLTAWSDKHPAYQLVNGHGTPNAVKDLFTPEINADVIPSTLTDTRGAKLTFPHPELAITGFVSNTEAYDQIKVDAILNEIDGKSSQGRAGAGTPALYGMNFQTVSVGQKLVDSTQKGNSSYVPGGYAPGSTSTAPVFTPQLAGALAWVDGALGQIVAELKAKGQWDTTKLIVSAKHGQTPMDPTKLSKPGDTVSSTLEGAGIKVAQVTTDDVAFVWLADQSKTADAVTLLTSEPGKAKASVDTVLSGAPLAARFADPSTDSRAPDLVVTPTYGTIYTSSSKKVTEHGGFGRDDTNVALLVVDGSREGERQRTITSPVTTTQIAPTILDALGLDPNKLDAVRTEKTTALPVEEILSPKVLASAPARASKPDDITLLDGVLYASYQNGVGAQGEPAGPVTDSTIVGFNPATGAVVKTYSLLGRCDGLTADPARHQLLATVNEDLNSSLYTIAPGGTPKKFTYSPSPAAPGGANGGTDAISVGPDATIYLAHSNPDPATGNTPAVYVAQLDNGVAHLTQLFGVKDPATDVVSHHTAPLALSDPDSNRFIPTSAPVLPGTLIQDAQGDSQLIFVKHPHTPSQTLSVLNLFNKTPTATGDANAQPQLDDIVEVTGPGTLYAADQASGKIYTIDTGDMTPGTLIASQPTPKPTEPANDPALSMVDPSTGVVTKLNTTLTSPKGLLFIPAHHDEHDDSSTQ